MRREIDIQQVVDHMREVIGQAARRWLAVVRLTAQSMIKPAGRSSPGQPPIGHTGRLRSSIRFSWDDAAGMGVVGPIRLPATQQSRPAPEVLEFGGAVRVAGSAARYEARPVVGPAFERAWPRFARYLEEASQVSI